jgi:hypothetical protein
LRVSGTDQACGRKRRKRKISGQISNLAKH